MDMVYVVVGEKQWAKGDELVDALTDWAKKVGTEGIDRVQALKVYHSMPEFFIDSEFRLVSNFWLPLKDVVATEQLKTILAEVVELTKYLERK